MDQDANRKSAERARSREARDRCPYNGRNPAAGHCYMRRERKSRGGSWSLLGIFAGLELLGKFQFALGVFGAAEVTVGEAEKVVGDIVVGIHCNGALQGANGELSFACFLNNFAEQNVRAGGSGIEPDVALQDLFVF